ncbi:MAG TPA: hypothetical protein VGW38_24005 [Chloroflexota bacterium]|nr:hypothetical protein [Chloroflexota bacterium]
MEQKQPTTPTTLGGAEFSSSGDTGNAAGFHARDRQGEAIAATLRVLRASVRLQRAEVEAARTGRWDEAAFERLVLDYCQAVQEAAILNEEPEEEQVDENHRKGAQPEDRPTAPPTREPSKASEAPTARWQFVRWLYLQGRISEGRGAGVPAVQDLSPLAIARIDG